MLVSGTIDSARPHVFEDGESRLQVRQIIGSVTESHRGPQAFSSTFPENYELPAHFHFCDQFQIVYDGSCMIGTHEADPISIHYSDSSTPYGPIRCGESGMSFFNVRATCDVGVEWMPESRKKIDRRGGREIAVQTHLSLADPARTLRVETLIDMHDDGLAAYELIVAPRAHLLQTDVAGGGRFQLIMDGSIDMDRTSLGRHAISFVAPGERFPARTAGAEGAHVLELQFPMP